MHALQHAAWQARDGASHLQRQQFRAQCTGRHAAMAEQGIDVRGFIAEHGNRDRMVIATKSGFPRVAGTPLAGGNSTRNIRDGIEGSLRRLGTDFIDMYWTHV